MSFSMKMVAPPATGTAGAHPTTDTDDPSPSPSPLLKLFGPDQVDGTRYIRPLYHVRKRIYFYLWSRERRDQEKLDWVVSSSGFNRNVPERFIPNTPYGTDVFHPDRLAKLPCNLHLVNKQISQDFLRYIYTVNHLEVDVDLQAVYTNQGEASFQKLITVLRNPSFQEHTRFARLRIHFPAEYPFNNLPAFNKQSLDRIAAIFDAFQQVAQVTVRLILSQGEPLDYEVPLALFPFMRMRMQNWTASTLNSTTCPYKWDPFEIRQAQQLHKAYDTYTERRRFGYPAPSSPSRQQPVRTQPVHTQPGRGRHARYESPPVVMASNKNGSQKKKARKLKRATEALLGDKPSSVDNLTTSTDATETVPSSSHGAQLSDAKMPGSKPSVTEVTSNNVMADTEDTSLEGIVPHIDTDICDAASADPPSLPRTPVQPRAIDSHAVGLEVPLDDNLPPILTQSRLIDSQAVSLSSSTSDSCPAILTPSGSSERASSPTNDALPSDTTDNKIADLQTSRSPSSASSSVTRGLETQAQVATQDAQGGVVGLNSSTMQPTDHRAKQKQAKKKRKRSKKSKTTTQSPDDQTDNESDTNAVHQDELDKEPSEEGLESMNSNQEFVVADQSPTVILAEYKLNVHVDRILRQEERLQKVRAQKEADQKQARDKRQTRKAKQLLLGRGGNVAKNSPLSRAMARPRTKKAVAENGGEATRAKVASDNGVGQSGNRLDLVFTNLHDLRSQDAEREMFEERGHIEDMEGMSGDDDDWQQGGHRFEFSHGSGDDDNVDSTVQGYAEGFAEEYSSERTHDPERHFGHREEMYDSAEELFNQSQVNSDAATYENPDDLQGSDLDYPASKETGPDQPYDWGTIETDGATDGRGVLDIDGLDNDGPSNHAGKASVTKKDDLKQSIKCYNCGDGGHHKRDCPHPKSSSKCKGRDGRCGARSSGRGERGDSPKADSSHTMHSASPTQQDARDRRASLIGQPPSHTAENDSRSMTRNAWSAAVLATDEAIEVENRHRRLELERRMKAKGVDYSDCAGPINDSWIKTDEDGRYVAEMTEQVIYGHRSKNSASPGSLAGTQEANWLQKAKKSCLSECPLDIHRSLGAEQLLMTEKANELPDDEHHRPVLLKSKNSRGEKRQPVNHECENSQDDEEQFAFHDCKES